MPPETAAELGLMTGVPPFPVDKLVDLGNWQDPPFSRWGFQHVRELIPTRGHPRRERRRAGPASCRAWLEVPAVGGSRATTCRTFLDETYTDGILVLHRGTVVTERYFNGMTPRSTHLFMSVTKSVSRHRAGSSSRAAALARRTVRSPSIPELEGTSWEGGTVRHLLDMRAGTKFNEDYEDLTPRYGCTSRSTCGVRASTISLPRT